MTGFTFVSLGTPPLPPTAPFSAFDDDIVRTVEEAICTAWKLLKTSAHINLATESEKVITAELQESIIDVLNNGYVAGFLPEIFNQPVRDGSVKDYSGKWLEKKPDLAFFVSSAVPLSANKGIFFECKLIGNVATYLGADGLGRFCDGRYAWAMPHAGMIGYVQRKTNPLSAQDAIKSSIEDGTLIVDSQYCDTAATYHDVWVSVHARDFTIANGSLPGSILIRHLWLKP